VIGGFDGGRITSDAGGLLLREVETVTGIIGRFSACFTDHRDERRVDHTVSELVAQRVYGLALGYADVNDHDDLRHDPLLATLVGKADPQGTDRRRTRDKGCALAGKSTLNRLERTPSGADSGSRYHKIVVDPEQVDRMLVDVFLDAYDRPPQEIILDLDATDDIIHGLQEGRFFHGYYGDYCYLPLYIFCGDHLLCARLRPSGIDASEGSVEELERIVAQIRSRWPEVRIIIRADSGFAREAIMSWCEANRVEYVLGLARNARLVGRIAPALAKSRRRGRTTGQASRRYRAFMYQTHHSWSRSRRVIAKAEHLPKGENPRFIVTNLPRDYAPIRQLYEDLYCARGDMENRIKEQQRWLFADRTSCATMWANQLRLWFSSVAYLLMAALRRIGLRGTRMSRAQAGTIRLKLFKIGAVVTISVRRIRIWFSESYPDQALFQTVLNNIRLQL
jgi:hypothetical protein